MYIPDDFYYCYIDEFFANRKMCNIIDDKNQYDLLFNDIHQPKTIARRINGVFLSKDYKPITRREVIALCKQERKVIIKKSTNIEGGKGISFFENQSDDESKLNIILNQNDFIIQ